MHFTIFSDQYATTKTEHDLPWEAFCQGIANAPEFASKAECRWISLARYGDQPTDKGCLRHAANVIAISGVEADFDRGDMRIEQAAEMARAAGLRAVFYTTPSSTPTFHRWRALTPLAREYPLAAREGFVSRLNGILGGVIAGESWNPAQGFLIGRIANAKYTCLTT